MPSTSMTRYHKAIAIRSAALAAIRSAGRHHVDLGDLTICHHGRHNPLPVILPEGTNPDELRICTYGLFISERGRRMFACFWDDADPRMEIETFVEDWNWPVRL